MVTDLFDEPLEIGDLVIYLVKGDSVALGAVVGFGKGTTRFVRCYKDGNSTDGIGFKSISKKSITLMKINFKKAKKIKEDVFVSGNVDLQINLSMALKGESIDGVDEEMHELVEYCLNRI